MAGTAWRSAPVAVQGATPQGDQTNHRDQDQRSKHRAILHAERCDRKGLRIGAVRITIVSMAESYDFRGIERNWQ